MDALRKQANKFKEQVAKQQQAVKKQFSTSGYEGPDVVVVDEVELQRHQQLEKLYKSTRSGRILEARPLHVGKDLVLVIDIVFSPYVHSMDFQKDIVRAVEALIANGVKHIEIGTKLSEDCCRYGSENINESALAKATSLFGGAVTHVEKEYEELNRILSSQVIEPLRAMSSGAPLEDARHLAQRYSTLRHEAEKQAAEVARRQLRMREAPFPENAAKLQMSESKMQELKSSMAVLGKEATASLSAVESQQQRLTLQRLVAMVETEKSFHLRVASILDDVQAEMVSEKQHRESMPPSPPQSASEKALYFLAEALHAFSATSEKELNLAKGDYVVVRQVAASGWAEGECRGRSGWFPFSYVERRHNVPTNKVAPGVF